MPRPESTKKAQAARVFRATNNISETARQVSVNRTTIQRWLKDPEFLKLEAPEEETPTGLGQLVPKAMKVLDDALDGKRITQAQIRAALEVVKASNAFAAFEERGESLAEIISKLDEEGALESD